MVTARGRPSGMATTTMAAGQQQQRHKQGRDVSVSHQHCSDYRHSTTSAVTHPLDGCCNVTDMQA
jgi:hypothetical protein